MFCDQTQKRFKKPVKSVLFISNQNQIRFISGNIWPIKTSRKTVNIKKTDRQTDIRTYNI